MGRPRKPEHRIKHGEASGKAWHIRRGEPPCAECKAWHARKMREARARKAKQRQVIRSILAGGQTLSRTDKYTNQAIDDIIKLLQEANIDPENVPTE